MKIVTENGGAMKRSISGYNAPFIRKADNLRKYRTVRTSLDAGRIFIEYEVSSAQASEICTISSDDLVHWQPAAFPASRFSPAGKKTELWDRNGTNHILSIENGRIISETAAGKETIDIEAERISQNPYIENIAAIQDEEAAYLIATISGSVTIFETHDGKNYMSYIRDTITYPDFGIVYDGDYYRAIPFSSYISKEEIPSGPDVYDVRDFGAINDTAVISTPAIQAAFDAAEANGGGTVLVSGGYYTTGTLSIPSNTTLFIASDSAICASKDLSRHKNMFIGCINAGNVAIRGGGKIICNGEYFVYPPKKRPLMDPLGYIKVPPVYFDSMGYPTDTIRYAYRRRIRYAIDSYSEGLPPIQRPMNNVWIRQSRNILIENIVIESSFEWSLNLEFSNNITVRNVVINDNRHIANTDGIDVTSSTDVEIDHCFISCADDGICIKAPNNQNHDGLHAVGVSSQMGPTRNVWIHDCTVLTVMNAFKIGTGTYHEISDITVENCQFMLPDIFPGSVSGISIECADGGDVKHIQIRNIAMQRVCCPIFICQNMRNANGFENEEARKARYYGGQISDVLITDITVDGEDLPCLITGFEINEGGKITERKVKDIIIRNYSSRYNELPESIDIKERIHENIRSYPESNSFGDLPAYGFYIRHAENVVLENVEVIPRSMNTRECIVRA